MVQEPSRNSRASNPFFFESSSFPLGECLLVSNGNVFSRRFYHPWKCPICDVWFEANLFKAHEKTSHPDYFLLRKRSLRLLICLMSFYGALTVVDLLYPRLLGTYFLLVFAGLIGTPFLLQSAYGRKVRKLSDAWKKTHPSSRSRPNL